MGFRPALREGTCPGEADDQRPGRDASLKACLQGCHPEAPVPRSASGFYEWKKEGARRVPFYIRLKAASFFSFAGLSTILRDPSGGELPSFVIITTEPNQLVADSHDRMPAILLEEKEESWIRPGPVGPADLEGILGPYPAGEMEAFPVSERVNDLRSEGPEVIQPLSALTFPRTSPSRPGT